MRKVLINYESINSSDLIGLEGLENTKIFLFYGPADFIDLSLGIVLKRLQNKIEFIRVDSADIEKINFNIALYVGFIKKTNPQDEIIIISSDTELISTLKSEEYSEVRLTTSIENLINEIYIDLTEQETIRYIEKDLSALQSDQNRRILVHKQINEILRNNNLSDVISSSSVILNAFIRTTNLEQFRQELINFNYKKGIQIYNSLESYYIKIRNTNKIF